MVNKIERGNGCSKDILLHHLLVSRAYLIILPCGLAGSIKNTIRSLRAGLMDGIFDDTEKSL